MFQALIGPIASLAGTFLEKKVTEQKAKATLAQTEAEAKAEIMKTAATHDSKWELIMAGVHENQHQRRNRNRDCADPGGVGFHSGHGRSGQKRL